MALIGSLKDLSVANIIQMKCQERAVAKLTVKYMGKIEGEIFFEGGQVKHAESADLVGEEAAYRILSLSDGEFRLENGISTPIQTINTPWNAILLNGMRMADETLETLADMLRLVVQKDASDLYLIGENPPSIGLHGRVVPIDERIISPTQSRNYASLLMTEAQRREFQQKMEMNLAYNHPELGRFRVNIFKEKGNIGIVFRRIKSQIPTFEELLLPNIIAEISLYPKGFVLVTGATGSGKSTTLASMIEYRNQHRAEHIITIEDPMEFVHNSKRCIISQREIGLDTISYEDALANALRQAPHLLLVGEMRTQDAVENALYYAETGHLVLSTLHATNSEQTIVRLLNFFTAERHEQILHLLSINLKAIICQRLIPKASGHGRVVATEIMLGSPAIRELIRRNELKKLKEIIKESNEAGMHTFDQDIFRLWKEGLISKEDALEYSDSPTDISLWMSGIRTIEHS